jgi:hypothetical protein
MDHTKLVFEVVYPTIFTIFNDKTPHILEIASTYDLLVSAFGPKPSMPLKKFIKEVGVKID